MAKESSWPSFPFGSGGGGGGSPAAIAAAEAEAISIAAADATTKANAAQAAAATDASTKADAAQAAAIASAASDATTKANTAQSNATSAAATDATNKVAAHVAATDPHGDRAYTDSTLATGLAGKQPVDTDLTAIAALDASTAGTIASDGSGWVKKTYAQLKTALGLVKADVGLSAVDNTSDVGKPISTATQTALNGKHDKFLVRRSVKDYGAVADALLDGTGTDDRAAIQSALNAGPGIVELTGFHKITSPGLTIPADVHLRGFGESTGLIGPNTYNFNVVRIDATNGRVSDMAIKRATGGVSSGVGVAVLGNSSNALVERVTVSNASTGFRSAGELGAVSGTVSRVTFRDCVSKNAEAYGFEVDNTDGIVLNNPQSVVSYQDGIKLRRMTKNVSVIGGYLSGGVIGDGMDCYAGGDQFTVNGTIFANNAINGLTIKNDSLNRTDPTNYGYVRNFSITGCIASGNTGNGFTAHRSSGNPDDPTDPLVVRGTFAACGSHNNGAHGFYIQSRQVTLSGCTSSRNGLDGFFLEAVSRDVALIGCHAAGNSTTTAGSVDGFVIDGSRIQVVACSSVGSDPDGALDDAALAAGTKTQRYGLRITSTATQVDVHSFNGRYNATADILDSSAAVRWNGGMPGVALIAGYYVSPGGTRSTLAMTQSVEYAVPVYIAMPGTIIKLGCEVTVAGAASTVIRLGIRSDLGHLPGAVLAEVTVAGDAVSASGVEATVSAVIPAPGVYWFTATAQGGTPTVRSCTGPTGMGSAAGSLATAVGATPNGGYISGATVTGTLPTTYTVSNRAGGLPLVVARI